MPWTHIQHRKGAPHGVWHSTLDCSKHQLATRRSSDRPAQAFACPRGFDLPNPKISLHQLCPNRVQNRGDSRRFRWTRVDSVRTQILELPKQCNNDARLPDARPRPHNPKVAGSNPAPATKKLKRHGQLARDAFRFWGLFANCAAHCTQRRGRTTRCREALESYVAARLVPFLLCQTASLV